MNLQLVKTPPHFRAQCLQCRKMVDTDRINLYADLDGEPFKAYYCEPCKVERSESK